MRERVISFLWNCDVLQHLCVQIGDQDMGFSLSTGPVAGLYEHEDELLGLEDII
jgi:hypothetical protein